MYPRLACSVAIGSVLVSARCLAADVVVDPTAGQAAISPYVYGANHVQGSTVKFTARRLGGNRLTGYNWENNFSNAGSDWQQSSDTYLCDDPSVCSEPGATLTMFVDSAQADQAYPLVTLQMAGYVSADADGTVTQAAPSVRWKEVVDVKGSAFTTSPDTSDDYVYMDELVAFLVGRYGLASEGGVPGYALDNEPALWSLTHALIHPDPVGAVELIDRSVSLASAIKSVDASAEVFGPVAYGYSAFVNLQGASDWNSVKGSYQWYLQYYLAQMAEKSQAAGVRLLDVLDLHFYSEATGNGVRVQQGTTENEGARVQSTRSLWDSSYGYSTSDPEAGENSWIVQYNDPVQLLPRVQGYIRDLYPGTKLAITEYDFGAADHISGGIAEADALGIFGKYGVYLATRWGDPGTFTDAAYRLYLDYDGQGSHFGDVSVSAETSDVAKLPVYASLNSRDPNTLHLVVINRDLTASQTAHVTLAGSSEYHSGHAWGFDSSGASLTDRGPVTVSDNGFSLDLPALSAVHVVLATDDPPDISVTPGTGGTGGVGSGSAGQDNGASETSDTDKGGCGCVVASGHSGSFWMLSLFAAALVVLRRRGRRPTTTRSAI